MKLNRRKMFLGGVIIVLIVCIGLYIELNNASIKTTEQQVAQLDVAAFNGGVITYETPIQSKVKKGQIVLKLNPEKYMAQLEVDKAKLMDDMQKYKRDQQLDAQAHDGAISAQDLASAKYSVIEDFQTIKLDKQYVRECTLKAPFDGTVTKIVNYTGSGVGNGNEIMDITATV